MKTFTALLLMSSAITTTALAAAANFDDAKPGVSPPGWTATQTGKGAAKRTVEKDETAPSKSNVLKQSGVAAYPICIKDDTSLKDGFVEVKFKALTGKDDQAGIWRAKDADNYYVARANALEDNIAIYHTVNGKRTEKKRVGMKVTPKQWHPFRVDFQGNHFKVRPMGDNLLAFPGS